MSRFFSAMRGTSRPAHADDGPARTDDENTRDFSALLRAPSRRALFGSLPLVSLAALFGLPACNALPSGEARPLIGFKPVPVGRDDQVRVPEGYSATVLLAWGEPIGEARGMPSFRPDASNSAQEQELQSGMNHDGMHFFSLPAGANGSAEGLLVINHEYPDQALLFNDGMKNWSLEKVRKSQAALGCSVQQVRLVDGRWQLVRPSAYARRITANTAMGIGGPAAGHERMRTANSADGRSAHGTFGNCANGWTPWGTYLTCEENFNYYFAPPAQPTRLEQRYGLSGRNAWPRWGEHDPRFDMNRDRNQPNHFGWIVEFDPYDPKSVPVKRTALGRFSHEVACHAVCADGRVAVYSGDDQPFEYIYKFVSARAMDPSDRAANRDLLDSGTLYVARFGNGGRGDWIELSHGKNGLTEANGFASQAEVVMYARAAGDQVGATRMDRPEWIARHPASGELYCSLTGNTARGKSGREGGNPANLRAPNPFGHIIRWKEAGNDPAATRFEWSVFALAGDPGHAKPAVRGDIDGDLYAMPDGLMIDARGVVWVQTDMPTSGAPDGDYAIYGNNQMLAVDPVSRRTRRFLTGPRGCEITGACMTPDGRTLFVNIQHPGEGGPDADGRNPRRISNWPDFNPDGRPRAATVVVRRNDGGIIGT